MPSEDGRPAMSHPFPQISTDTSTRERAHLSPKRGVALPPFLERGQPGPPPGADPFPNGQPKQQKPSPRIPRIQTTDRHGLQIPDKRKALTPTRDGSQCPVRLKSAAFIQRPQLEALVLKQPTGTPNQIPHKVSKPSATPNL